MTRVIGLTGGIGTGKSSVARMFEKLGAVVIDADAIVHELQAPGMPVLEEIARAFGPSVIDADGALDRAALSDLVFRDPEARRRLNEIMHPRVGEEMVRRAAAARAAEVSLIVLDIPLLLEGRATGKGSAASRGIEFVVVVYAPERAQIERQMRRDGAAREDAERRVGAQLSIETKRELADFVIDNSGSLEATERQVRELYARLTAMAP